MKHFEAKWIGIPGRCMIDYRRRTLPAPEFRRCFVLERRIEHPIVYISGLGYFEWSINGRHVTQDVLVPSPTQYDLRWRYMRYELDFALEASKPYLFSVIVGNGMYNPHTPDSAWHFEHASWRDYPKMIFQLESEDKALLLSDSSWVTCFSPTLFDGFRGGETYDARRELPLSLDEPEADTIAHNEIWQQDMDVSGEQSWHHAWIVAPPGGVGEEQKFPGCRVIKRYAMAQTAPAIWSAPYNASGYPEIKVRGKAGARIKLTCGELLSKDGMHLDIRQISAMTAEHFQEATYILKGEGTESWHPRFAFYGFRFVEVECTGEVEIVEMQQVILRTGFDKVGCIRTSSRELQLIDECAERSNIANFVGYPTDCPHREKNGWTSEAMLMCPTMLYMYDCASSYAGYLDTIIDTQRPSGQISCIAPCAGWGYNWGSGGHWDLALFEIPWMLWLATGKNEYLSRAYPAMKRNLDFQESVSDDGICFSLGDWISAKPHDVPVGASASACRIYAIELVIRIAREFGDIEYAEAMEARRQFYIGKYNEHFYLGGGLYRGEGTVYQAMALNWHIVPEEARAACIRHLKEMVIRNRYQVDFGTIGSRQVPMALFENGLEDEAYQMMIQPECPGYQFMLNRRHNFTEYWDALNESLNHGAFTYIAACLYKYLAGFRHTPEQPGGKHLLIAPVAPAHLADFSAEYRGFSSSWRRDGNNLKYHITVPDGCTAAIKLPDETIRQVSAGRFIFEL